MKKQGLKFWITFGIVQFVIWIVLILKHFVLLEASVLTYVFAMYPLIFIPQKYRKLWIVYFTIAMITFVCCLKFGVDNLMLSFLCAFTAPGAICVGVATDEYK